MANTQERQKYTDYTFKVGTSSASKRETNRFQMIRVCNLNFVGRKLVRWSVQYQNMLSVEQSEIVKLFGYKNANAKVLFWFRSNLANVLFRKNYVIKFFMFS